MRKSILVGLSFLLFSCGNKEIQLPKADGTIVANVLDNSTVYLFFETNGKDTLVNVNRENTIASTNWLFAIDKRLPLRLVIPEVIKLQAKKNSSDHKNEKAENYFSYMDNVKKSLAFLPFTKVAYKLEKPEIFESFVCFKKNGLVKINNDTYSNKELSNLNNLFIEHDCEIIFSFDKNLSFDEYIQNKILIKNLVIKRKGIRINYDKEFIY